MFSLTGTIYVVGGNDGTSALNSTEIYDRKTGSWVLGPMLSVPRANVGVAVLENKLFAVGGFNGKKFLDTLEYLDIGHTDEWCSYLPMEYEKRKSSTDDIGSGDQNISDDTNGSCGRQRVETEKEMNGTEISKNKSSGNVNDLKSLKSLQAESNGVSCNGGINGHTEEERNS